MEPNREYSQAPVRDDARGEIDYGLQAFMRKVLNTMSVGLAITGGVSFAVANTPAVMNLILNTPLSWVVTLAPLFIIWFGFGPKTMQNKTVGQLQTRFYIVAGLFGLSIASIFLVYTGASIARVFFITAAMFAGTALWGYTTKKDLSGFGSFLFMGLVGLIIAMVVNWFLKSPVLHFVTSALGVFIFTGLIAFETQRMKQMYYQIGSNAEMAAKVAIQGALGLYLSFLNLFIFLLQFLGDRN